MATPTLASTAQRRGRVVRVVAGLLIVLVAIAAVAAGWLYFQARSALPRVDGRVQTSGISASVTVIRDAQGVPHIRGSSMEDLLFAQGYVTAQDRLWQMDALRRAALGDLAEVVGPAAVERDRQQRLLLIRPTAERAIGELPPAIRAYFEAYARGVNALIESQSRHLPVEFRVLGYKPRPWKPEDSIAVGLFLQQMLAHGQYRTQLSREKILAKLGPELASDLYPTSSWHDHPPAAQARQPEEVPLNEDDEDEQEATPVTQTSVVPQGKNPHGVEAGWFVAPAGGGSNNWVVSGAHTVSGKPLLSNDMHLQQQMPSIWYELQMKTTAPDGAAANFDVAGFTLPGLPFVLVGHNQRIAWGATYLGADVEDLFIETFNQQGEYLTPEGWKKPEVRHETVRVKGRSDFNVDVVITRHGPLISELVPGETRRLALQWGPLKDIAFANFPFFELDSAQNWDDFRHALSKLGGPSLNLAYADADGHIGYQAAGRVPVRTAPTNGIPVPGDNNGHEWTGVVPFEKLPSVYDPPSGIIATANARITPDKYPYRLASDWMAPHRTERIFRVLQSGRKFAPEDMLALQVDVRSEFDHFCAERFVYGVDHVKNASARARTAADLMRSWDGQVTLDSAAATLVVRVRAQLWRMLLEPKLGPDYKLYHWGMQSVALENILLHQPEHWLPPKYPNYDELVAAALEAVVSSSEAPKSLSSWSWGEAHMLSLQHPVLGHVPVLRKWAGPDRYQISGDGYTVKQIGLGESYTQHLAPSERMTVDFSNLDASTMNIVTGESGQIFSPHYLDQWKPWLEGRTFLFAFSDAAVNNAKRHELRLEPAK